MATKKKSKNLPYAEKYDPKTRSKPLAVYLSKDERDKFIIAAEPHKMSLSKWVKNTCLAHIGAEPGKPEIDPKDIVIESLRAELALLQSKFLQSVKPIENNINSMSDEIYNIIKNAGGSWISQDELYNVFNIEDEEHHDDFYIAMNEFQSQHLNPPVQPDGYIDDIDIEFSIKLNSWRLKK